MRMLKQCKLDVMAATMGSEKAKAFKIRPNNYCVRDGDDENYEGYENCWFVSAANNRDISPNQRGGVKLVGRDKRALVEADGILYAGCHVNAIISMWFQRAGKKKGQDVPNAVYAGLEAVQFLEKGDAFGAPEIDVDQEFDDVTDDSDFQDPDEEDDSGIL